jgi:hypothetical protein
MRHSAHFSFGLAFGASGILFLFLAPTSAFAFDNCAAYGPDFTPVEGTSDCVKIGGHMRVESNAHTAAYYHDAARPMANATSATLRSDGGGFDFPQPHHVRVDGSDLVEGYR